MKSTQNAKKTLGLYPPRLHEEWFFNHPGSSTGLEDARKVVDPDPPILSYFPPENV